MTIEVLRCLLLPLQSTMLMLPYSAVAEVVPLENPSSFTQAKDWRLGNFEWRGLQVPLICIEMFDSSKSSVSKFVPQPNQRIAVLNRCSVPCKAPNSDSHSDSDSDSDSDSKDDPNFFGIVIAGIPTMSRYKPSDVHYIADGDKPFVQMKVTARNVAASIPNLHWIEEEIKKKNNPLPPL